MTSGPISIERKAVRGITRAPCPFCHAKLEVGQRLCGACGKDPVTFDPETAPNESSARTCAQCDYDLHGIVGAVCPECGAAIRTGRVRQSELIADEIERNEIRKPLWLGGISIVVWLGICVFQHGLFHTAIQLIAYPVTVFALGLTFVMYSALGGGIDPPLWLIALRMAAIVPAVKAVITIFSFSNQLVMLLAGGIFGLLLFTYLVVKLFDLELLDVKYLMLLHFIVWMTIQALLKMLF